MGPIGWPAVCPPVEGSRAHRCCPSLEVTFPIPAGSWAQPMGCRTLAAAGPWVFSDVDREQWSGAGSRDTGRPSGTTKNFPSSVFSDEAVPGVLSLHLLPTPNGSSVCLRSYGGRARSQLPMPTWASKRIRILARAEPSGELSSSSQEGECL